MKKTTLKIKMLYNEMGNAEKKIADWIFENPSGIIPLSISELAEQCGCGEATIVRFARRVGFGGYQELKISLAQEEGKKEINDTISAQDSCFEVFEKISNDIYCTLEMTKKFINRDAFNSAANLILNARQIVVFGLGNSGPIALDMQHKFLRVGYNIHAYTDNHMQAIAASQLTSADVAVGISHSGSSHDIVEALEIAKKTGAKTISITNHGKSPIIKQSDLVLSTTSDETRYSILGLNSRIAQLAIVDALYSFVLCQNSDTHTAIKFTEQALQTKKY